MSTLPGISSASISTDDAFAAIEQAAMRRRVEADCLKLMRAARTALVIAKSATMMFFARLTLALEFTVAWELPTMATDGKRLYYNPVWSLALTLKARRGVFVHEVFHCALNHMTRRGTRDPKRWNLACDCAVNPLVIQAGFELPPGGVFPKHYGLPDFMSAEWYYLHLPANAEQDFEGPGDVQDGGGDPAEKAELERQWKVSVAQAATLAAQGKGDLPAGIQRLVEEVLDPKVDWPNVLREWIVVKAKSDYTWQRPNRRYAAAGLYLPALESEELGNLVAFVDTSGSIGKDALVRFASELQGVLECYPCKLTILYHDAKVQHVQTWEPSDGPLLTLEPKGGGGTSHLPAFDHVDLHAEDIAPVACIALTDMDSDFPSAAPAYPVLWCKVPYPNGQFSRVMPPFGEVLEVELT